VVSGWTQWMENGVRAWWMLNKNNNLIKKGVKGVNMGIDLLCAGDNQGCQ
jgi:hypothetical protein